MHDPTTAPRTDAAKTPRLDEGGTPQFTWRRLLSISGSVTAVAFTLAAAAMSDIEAAVVAAGFFATAFLLPTRWGGVGAAGLALLSAVALFFMGTAAIVNVSSGSTLRSVAISAGLAALSLVTLSAGLAVLVGKADRGPNGPSVTVVAALAALTVALAAGAATDAAVPPTVDAAVVTDNLAFSPPDLTASAGEVTVAVTNDDLFWHTFTVPDLGVDLPVPAGGERTVTFDAPPGTYEIVCRIPGHTEAGMVGTIAVAG